MPAYLQKQILIPLNCFCLKCSRSPHWMILGCTVPLKSLRVIAVSLPKYSQCEILAKKDLNGQSKWETSPWCMLFPNQWFNMTEDCCFVIGLYFLHLFILITLYHNYLKICCNAGGHEQSYKTVLIHLFSDGTHGATARNKSGGKFLLHTSCKIPVDKD